MPAGSCSSPGCCASSTYASLRAAWACAGAGARRWLLAGGGTPQRAAKLAAPAGGDWSAAAGSAGVTAASCLVASMARWCSRPQDGQPKGGLRSHGSSAGRCCWVGGAAWWEGRRKDEQVAWMRADAGVLWMRADAGVLLCHALPALLCHALPAKGKPQGSCSCLWCSPTSQCVPPSQHLWPEGAATAPARHRGADRLTALCNAQTSSFSCPQQCTPAIPIPAELLQLGWMAAEWAAAERRWQRQGGSGQQQPGALQLPPACAPAAAAFNRPAGSGERARGPPAAPGQTR